MSSAGDPTTNRDAPSPSITRHHTLTQAPVAAVDADGVTVTAIGTGLFALATVLLVVLGDRLRAAGDGWWLWVGVAGTLLGLVGVGFCGLRRRRRAAGHWTYN